MFARTDLNVPRDGDRILDDTRIRASVPTLRELAAAGAKVLVFSHYGRPKGKPRPDQSLRPVAEALGGSLGAPVAFATDCVGEAAESAARATPAGGFCLFENLRFHAGERRTIPSSRRSSRDSPSSTSTMRSAPRIALTRRSWACPNG